MSAKHDHRDQVIEALDRHRQRATYGAVGGLVCLPARSVMQGQVKNPRNSWVVSSASSAPTGYAEDERHPLLESNELVIKTAEALADWWKDHR